MINFESDAQAGTLSGLVFVLIIACVSTTFKDVGRKFFGGGEGQRNKYPKLAKNTEK